MIRSADLQGARILAEDGRRLGHVRELHVKDGALYTLVCGGGGLLQRFWPSRRGRRIPWDQVREVSPGKVVVAIPP